MSPDPQDNTRRLTAALFCAGVATFAELYAVQAVLPQLAEHFQTTAAHASLLVSVATGALAISVLFWAQIADRIGRIRAMEISVLLTAVAALSLPAIGDFTLMLVVRGISGAVLAAVPAVALAHAAAQVSRTRVVAIAGTYIAGTSLGGLSGRLVSGWFSAGFGFTAGLMATGVMVAAAAVAFCVLIPGGTIARLRSGAGWKEPLPAAGRGELRSRLATALGHRRGWIYHLQGLLLMGTFVTVYNLLSFRLIAPPYNLPEWIVSSLFIAYLAGTIGSGMIGPLSQQLSRRWMLPLGGVGMALGVGLLTLGPMWAVVIGLPVFTFAFFLAHGIASGMPGALLPQARSQAAALYSLNYYAGSSVVGYVGGMIFTHSGWYATMGFLGVLMAIAIGVACLAGAELD